MLFGNSRHGQHVDLYGACDSCGRLARLTFSPLHDAHFCPSCLRREVPDPDAEHEPYRFWWGETSDAPAVAVESMPLVEVLAGWVPSSMPQPWSWDDEERAIFERVCLCCGQVGHHQRQLEAFLAQHGLTEGVCLGECGRVFDGHHRIVAARRLGIEVLPLESLEDSGTRWVRDHGPVSWENREKGDITANLYRPRLKAGKS